MDVSFLKRPAAQLFCLLLIFLLAWHLYLFLQTEKQTLANYLFNAGYGFVLLTGATVGLYGVKQLTIHSTIGKSIFFLSISLFSYAIGQFVWLYYNLIATTETPYPSIADGFFILFIPLMVTAVWYINTMFLTRISKRLVIESLIFFGISAACIFFFFANPDISEGLPFLTKFFNISYPLSDAVLIALALLTVRITKGKIHTSVFFLITGLLLQAGADLIFSYRTTQNMYWNGDISDLLFALSSVGLSLCIVSLLSDFATQE